MSQWRKNAWSIACMILTTFQLRFVCGTPTQTLLEVCQIELQKRTLIHQMQMNQLQTDYQKQMMETHSAFDKQYKEWKIVEESNQCLRERIPRLEATIQMQKAIIKKFAQDGRREEKGC